jgi:UDP-N-acetylglucosamine--N-acetylmuramyl-(pentapeptide) pyrophosphoryl-undecaprenol N-acetylglucosamine transferase
MTQELDNELDEIDEKVHNKKNIFVVGGGTGGHLFPCLSLGQELQKNGYRIYLITDSRCIKYLHPSSNLKVRIIDSETFRAGFFQKIYAIFKIASATIKSIYLILKKKPKLVVGFGGYPSLPMMLAARITSTPCYIHEQNSYMGSTNLFCAKFAKKIFLSFDPTVNLPKNLSHKAHVVGNPVREEIFKIDATGKYDKKPTVLNILIFGGSQSASFFTTIMPNVFRLLKESKPNLKFHVIQQVQKSDIPKLKRAYLKMNISAEVKDFFHDMDEQYKNAHIIIARSGASTIAEIISSGTPAIFIPYPHSSNDHQNYNAMFLDSKNASFCYNQQTLTPKMIASKIEELALKPSLLKKTSGNLLALKQNSLHNLTNRILEEL